MELDREELTTWINFLQTQPDNYTIKINRYHFHMTSDLYAAAYLTQIMDDYDCLLVDKTEAAEILRIRDGILYVVRPADDWQYILGFTPVQIQTSLSKLNTLGLVTKEVITRNNKKYIYIALNYTKYKSKYAKIKRAVDAVTTERFLKGMGV